MSNLNYEYSAEYSNPFLERSQSVQEPFLERSCSVPSMNEKRSVNENNAVWRVHTARSHAKNRYGVEKNITSAVCVLIVLACTLLKINTRVLLMLYIALTGVLALLNPLDAIGRFLAKASRIIIAFMCLSWLVMALAKSIQGFMAMLLVCSAGGFLIYHFNSKWLASDDWLASDAMQKTLRNDPEQLSSKNWQADGCRESKTTAYELGLATDDKAVEAIYKPFYQLGYNSAMKKEKAFEKMQKSVAQAKEEVSFYQNRCKLLEGENESALRDNAELEAQIKAKLDEHSYWRKKFEDLQKENIQLRQANEELLTDFADDLNDQRAEKLDNIVVLHAEKTLEEKVIEARQSGASYSECGRIAGCSKTKAYDIYRNYEMAAAK